VARRLVVIGEATGTRAERERPRPGPRPSRAPCGARRSLAGVARCGPGPRSPPAAPASASAASSRCAGSRGARPASGSTDPSTPRRCRASSATSRTLGEGTRAPRAGAGNGRSPALGARRLERVVDVAHVLSAASAARRSGARATGPRRPPMWPRSQTSGLISVETTRSRSQSLIGSTRASVRARAAARASAAAVASAGGSGAGATDIKRCGAGRRGDHSARVSRLPRTTQALHVEWPTRSARRGRR